MYEPEDAVTWTLSRPHGMSRPITSPERFRACSVAPCARFRPAGPRHRDGAAFGVEALLGHQRGPVAAVRRRATAPPFPIPAQAIGLQQAAAPARGHVELADRSAGS